MHLVRDALPGPPRGPPIVSRAVRPVRLLVCGNADRGDDGAPLAAVASLLPSLPPHLLADLDVRRCEQLQLEDLIELPVGYGLRRGRRGDRVRPGAVVTIALSDVPARDAAFGPVPRSSHILPIGQIVAMAEVMRGRPVEGSLVAIGGTLVRVRAGARSPRARGAAGAPGPRSRPR